MTTQQSATSAKSGQSFPPITEQDLKRLRFALQGIEDETIDAEMFRRIHDVLLERYGREQISEATDRWRAKGSEGNNLDLNFVPIEDFMSEQIPEPPNLIDGILYKGGIMLLTGAAKTNKSWTAKEIAISIAQGNPWLDFDCAKGRVLYVNNEIMAFTLQKRLRMLMDEQAIGPVPNGSITLLNLRDVPADITQLVEGLIRKINPDQFSAIIIDPIYTLLGELDENDNKDVKEVGNALKQLAGETKAAVIFVHHHSKGNQGNKRSLERASGAGAWGRFPDAVLDIDKQNEKEKLFRMSVTLRDFEAPDDFLARRIVPGPRWDKSAITVEEAEADIEAAKQAAKEKEDGKLFKDIADLVRDGEKVSSAEWQRRAHESLGIGRPKYEQGRNWLLDQRIVFKAPEKGPKNCDLYYFPAPKGQRFESQD
jgi:hypothetical protein